MTLFPVLIALLRILTALFGVSVLTLLIYMFTSSCSPFGQLFGIIRLRLLRTLVTQLATKALLLVIQVLNALVILGNMATSVGVTVRLHRSSCVRGAASVTTLIGIP